MKLRPHQNDAINAIRSRLASNKTALVYASVAFGKSVLMREISLLAKGNVLICVPRISLIKQTAEKIPGSTIYCAGLKQKVIGDITVSTLQSIVKVKHKFKIIMIDEVHMLQNSQKRLLESMDWDYVIGMSGTPFNVDNEFWGKPCYRMTIKELTKLGYLTPLKINAPSKDSRIETSGIKVSGDYNLGQLYERYKDKIHAQVKDALSRLDGRKHVLWLCVNIEHAEAVAELIDGELVHSKKNNGDIIERFRNGEIKHLVSVAMISTGFDAPCADALVMMRATRAPELFLQSLGRILRLYEGKQDALFLDYGRIVEELGHPYEIVDAKTRGEQQKICPDCESYNPSSAIACGECGEKFLTMCGICLEPKEIGYRCKDCKKVKRNVMKSLSEKACGSKYPLVADVITKKGAHHKSKAGNPCMKITFFCSGMDNYTAYFRMDKKWSSDEYYFLMRRNVKKVVVDKVNGYEKIVEYI